MFHDLSSCYYWELLFFIVEILICTLYQIVYEYSSENREGKNGRMEEWKNGRMEGGRMEEWENGRIEEWENGRIEEWKGEEWEDRRMEGDRY